MRKIVLALTLLLLTSVFGLVECCHVPPAKTLEKYFYYEGLNPDLFKQGTYPVEGLPVDVSLNYGGTTYTWHFVSDKFGCVKLAGVPSGDYKFNWTWNGIPDEEILSICCAKEVWVFENYLDAKGGTGKAS